MFLLSEIFYSLERDVFERYAVQFPGDRQPCRPLGVRHEGQGYCGDFERDTGEHPVVAQQVQGRRGPERNLTNLTLGHGAGSEPRRKRNPGFFSWVDIQGRGGEGARDANGGRNQEIFQGAFNSPRDFDSDMGRNYLRSF